MRKCTQKDTWKLMMRLVKLNECVSTGQSPLFLPSFLPFLPSIPFGLSSALRETQKVESDFLESTSCACSYTQFYWYTIWMDGWKQGNARARKTFSQLIRFAFYLMDVYHTAQAAFTPARKHKRQISFKRGSATPSKVTLNMRGQKTDD